MSFKLEPSAIPDLPEPRPKFEIFVYSPRVEGVHLRFGAVARGGLRWSDRRDDFRTEVLGLVKAQMVKNTVIVPVGAKGGFFCKQLPDPADRDAWLAEGVACYKTFICGLLDITDNLVDGETRAAAATSCATTATTPTSSSPPTRAPRRSPTSPTASPRTTASGSATRSPRGGSVGYDHKAMGITARGAWVSVQRHFRERGIDCQTEDFTVRRHRRHVRRRVRQRHALLRAHPAGGGVRPPRHLPRPDARRGDVVRRAQAAVRPAALELAGLRRVADLRGRRRLPALAEVDPAHRRRSREALGIDESTSQR